MSAQIDHFGDLAYLLDSRRDRLSDLLASLPVGLCVLSSSFTIVAANRACLDLLGLGEEAIGRAFFDAVQESKLIERAQQVLRGDLGGRRDVYIERGVRRLRISLSSQLGSGTGERQLRLIVSEVDPTILLVEEDKSLRELWYRYLAKDHYDVVCASSVKDALVQAATNRTPIDLLVTNDELTGLTGRDLGEILTAWVPGLLFLVIGHDARGIPGERFLGRPFMNVDLPRKVREVFGLPPPQPPESASISRMVSSPSRTGLKSI